MFFFRRGADIDYMSALTLWKLKIEEEAFDPRFAHSIFCTTLRRRGIPIRGLRGIKYLNVVAACFEF